MVNSDFLFCKRLHDDSLRGELIAEGQLNFRKWKKRKSATQIIHRIYTLLRNDGNNTEILKRNLQCFIKRRLSRKVQDFFTVEDFYTLFEQPWWMDLWTPADLGWWCSVLLRDYERNVSRLFEQCFTSRCDALLWFFLGGYCWKRPANRRSKVPDQGFIGDMVKSLSTEKRVWLVQEIVELAPGFGVSSGLGEMLFGHFVLRDPNEAELMLSTLLKATSKSRMWPLFYESIKEVAEYYNMDHFPWQDKNDKIPGVKDLEFQYPGYRRGSTWLQDRFWNMFKNTEGELGILNFLLDRNNVSTARAFAFEPYVFRTLENTGISGRLKKLTNTADGSGPIDMGLHRIDPYVRRTFHGFKSDLPVPKGDNYSGVFYIPAQTNHMSCNLYVPDRGLLIQVTVAAKTGINRKSIEDARNSRLFEDWIRTHPGQRLRIIFLCDQYNFLKFQAKQPYLEECGAILTPAAVIASGFDKRFDQFALELDVRLQQKKYLEEHTPVDAKLSR
jgi:hypothetical protein